MDNSSVEWVDELPGRPATTRDPNVAVERDQLTRMLSERPGLWGRLKDFDDNKGARMASLRYKRDGFQFAVRQTNNDPATWSLFGRCLTTDQAQAAEAARAARKPRKPRVVKDANQDAEDASEATSETPKRARRVS